MTSIASVDQTTPAEIAAPATSRAMRVLGPLAAALAMLSAFATFVVLADLTPIAPTHSVVVTLLLINALTVFLLVGIIAHEVWLVVQARRRGRAAARLHVQIVGLFAVIAAVPAILVAVVASVTLDRGLDRLFSTRTRAIIENSLIVADAYLQEHAQTDPRRHHGDVVRRVARQAAVRFRARALQAVLHRAGEGARACRRR